MAERTRVAAISAAAAAGLALAAAFCLVRRRQKRRARAEASLSSRGERMLMPALPYMGGVIEAFMNPYDAEKNPDGLILLAVAENKLSWDVLKPRIHAALATCPDWVSNYGPMSGQPPLKEALAAFLGRRVAKGCAVRPDDLVCASGLTSILSNFFYVLCEPGETVLIPAPYYAAFDSDLRAFAEVEIEQVPVEGGDVASPTYGSLSVAALDAAFERVLSRTVSVFGGGWVGEEGRRLERTLTRSPPHHPTTPPPHHPTTPPPHLPTASRSLARHAGARTARPAADEPAQPSRSYRGGGRADRDHSLVRPSRRPPHLGRDLRPELLRPQLERRRGECDDA